MKKTRTRKKYLRLGKLMPLIAAHIFLIVIDVQSLMPCQHSCMDTTCMIHFDFVKRQTNRYTTHNIKCQVSASPVMFSTYVTTTLSSSDNFCLLVSSIQCNCLQYIGFIICYCRYNKLLNWKQVTSGCWWCGYWIVEEDTDRDMKRREQNNTDDE